MSFEATWANNRMRDTHYHEMIVACYLNKQLMPRDMIARRIEGDPYSPYDIGVFSYDLDNLKQGREICKIDLERKISDPVFPKRDIPKRWTRGASFAERKISKPLNLGRDVYALFDCQEYPRIIWATYQDIRVYGVFEEYRGYKNRFYTLPKDRLNYGYKSLVEWCQRLKNEEVIPA